MPRVWLGRMYPKWPVLCRVGCKTLAQSIADWLDWRVDYCNTGDAGKSALEMKSSSAENSSGGIERKSTRLWAEQIDYDTSKLFNKAQFITLSLYCWLWSLNVFTSIYLVIFNAALRSRCGHYIFALWFLLLFFFPCIISAVAEWMSTILLHMVWP